MKRAAGFSLAGRSAGRRSSLSLGLSSGLFAAVGLLLGLAGCGGAGTCSYEGKSYSSGERFPAADGCNTCSCGADGQVACTELACGGGQCTYPAGQGGKVYRAGESFPSTDACNSCACQADGQVVCTLRACPAGCSYNGTRYNAGDSFPASDGCNTCTCDVSGNVGCTKRACPATGWLSLKPVQCQGNPWEKLTPKGDGTEPSYPIAELLTIDRYFRDQGIKLQELGLVDAAAGIATCDACNCARGDRLLVRASGGDVATLVARHGFSAVQAGVLQTAPRQCGANPWKPAPAPLTPRDEAKNVVTWAAGIGAPLTEAGFAYPTVLTPVCLACNCPRGDRLAVYPKDSNSTTILTKQGFAPLP